MSVTANEDQDGLAFLLNKWALEQMQLRPQGRHVNARTPAVEDFKSICRGQVREVWKFVIKHVYSTQTVRKVQGNLLLKNHLNSGGYSAKPGSLQDLSKENTALLEERHQLSSQLNSTLSSVGLLEQDISRLAQDILNTDQSISEVNARVQDLQKRAAILCGHSHHVTEEVAKFQEYTNRIRTKTESYTSLGKNPAKSQFFSKQSSGENPSESGALESACTRQVRETCQHVEAYLQRLIRGDFSKDKNLLQTHRERLWKCVEDLTGSHSPVQLLLSLTNYTQDSSMNLRQLTASIDVHKDVEKLRFKYEKSGELLDTSSPPSELQSVHQLMEESQANHFHQFLMNEKSENKAKRLQQQLNKTTELIYTKIQANYTDPGAAQLARHVFEAELQTAGYRAVLRTLNEVADELRQSIKKAAHEKELLYLKYQKIQDFKLLVEKEQNINRMLLKENLASRTHVNSQQSKILKYVQSALGHHEANVTSLGTQVTDGVLKEVEKFAKLSMPCLVQTALDSGQKVCVEDLSINRISRVSVGLPTEQALNQVLQALTFPKYKAPECVLPWVIKMQQEADDLTITLQACHSHGHASPTHKWRQKEALDHFAELCKEVRCRDREALEKVLPVLETYVSQATQAITDCENLRHTTELWWDQPAQTTVPWLKVDEQSLQQWRNKWTVAVTSIRQLNIKPAMQPHGAEFAF